MFNRSRYVRISSELKFVAVYCSPTRVTQLTQVRRITVLTCRRFGYAIYKTMTPFIGTVLTHVT